MVESQTYDLDLIFHALADPTRRAMLRSLSEHEKAVTDVAQPFQMSLAAVSKHVKVLERAKLIRRRRSGSFYYLSLNKDAMLSIEEWVISQRKFWPTQLGSLKRFIEEENDA
jgi:DNA-binding transcriptional ArsR family regulator